jgi:hypothetical protein
METASPLTRCRVESIWQYCKVEANEDHEYSRLEFIDAFNERRDSENPRIKYTAVEQVKLIRSFCLELYQAVEHPENHFSRIDDTASTLMGCQLIAPSMKRADECVVNEALSLLKRLPDTTQPLPLDTIEQTMLKLYRATPLAETNLLALWEGLQSVRNRSTNVIRMALFIADRDGFEDRRRPPRFTENFANMIAGILDAVSRASKDMEMHTPMEKVRWYVVKAFLWTMLQQAIMLHFWSQLDRQLEFGYNFRENLFLSVRGSPVFDEVLRQGLQQEAKPPGHAAYMCNWAYELMRLNIVATTLDLRRFHGIYNERFFDREARCNGNQVCGGLSPNHCRRFQGATIINQSGMIFVVLELALAFTGIDGPTLRMEQVELELCAYLVGRHLSSTLRLMPILLLSRTSEAMAKVEDHILE